MHCVHVCVCVHVSFACVHVHVLPCVVKRPPSLSVVEKTEREKGYEKAVADCDVNFLKDF